MAQNINRVGVVHKAIKILRDFAAFIISPWSSKASIKSLQKRVDSLEQGLYESLPNTEQRLESLIENLQYQFNFLEDSTKNRLENLLEYDLRQQVLNVLKEETDIVIQNIKPIVEDMICELGDNQILEGNHPNVADIQLKQHQLQESLAQIQQLTTSLPSLEAQSAACLEAGFWLLAHREEVAQEVAHELLGSQHPQIEVFRYNLSKYLKLLGSCLENGIEPRLLYQGIITHQQPPVETYTNAFKLIQDKYISYWEESDQVSTEAAVELRGYFNYLIDYLVKVLV
ncbi:hypothetical protein [Mastigocladopsis repens]|uniref:hypothetical protein n=1 Tax=Mastigocladopsis repens TaxID=221287 RepID=UPI0002F24FE2|nr:hypothetical protein [Mastigocladopsis repens]